MVDTEKASLLLAKLNEGREVSLRDLRAALGQKGVDEYERSWQYELELRKQFDDKPDQIKRYEELIRAADFDEVRAEAAKPNSARSTIDARGRTSKKRLRELAEAKYEAAMVYLQEIVEADQNIVCWFDRVIDFDPKTTVLSIDRVGMPRTVTSRSINKVGDGMAAKRSKNEVKREVLVSAIESVTNNGKFGINSAMSEEETQLIKRKLAELKTGR
jgi:hypothetical protein